MSGQVQFVEFHVFRRPYVIAFPEFRHRAALHYAAHGFARRTDIDTDRFHAFSFQIV